MKLHALIVVVAVGTLVAACGKKENPVKTSGSEPFAVTATTPATADRDTPPAPVPSTHNLAPQSAPAAEASSTPSPSTAPSSRDTAPVPSSSASDAAPTARDTAAQQPLKDLTAAESANSLPKPGQVNNHSSTALDDAKKADSSASAATATTPPGTAAPAK